MNGNKSWILYGPGGVGKTTIARRLADHLGLDYIKDGWDGKRKTLVALETLHITNVDTRAQMDASMRARTLTSAQARELIGWPRPPKPLRPQRKSA